MIRSRSFACGLTAALLLLSGCGEPAQDAVTGSRAPPSPLFYEVASADGSVIEGWLLGTIHALPDGTAWETAPIAEAIAQAEVLVVEVAQLGDGRTAAALFKKRSAADEPGDLALRLEPALRPALAELLADSGESPAALRDLDTWAAVLTLAQGVRHGDPANGVDRALIAAFADKDVIELEGLAFQFDLFDTLPEREQRDLLAALVRDHQRWSDDPGHVTRKWLAGDATALADPGQSALLADPELREALLTRRNAAWAGRIDGLLAGERSVLVAVGAAHLPGPDGLAAILARYGYTVRPVR